MDLSKPVWYRGQNINSAALEPGRTLRGISIEGVDYSDIETAGYTEKRAGSDGSHASDVYLGMRAVNMSGMIYGTSLAELFDYLHIMRSTFSPTSAYTASPGDRGFLPMTFQQPTGDVGSFPEGFVPLYMNLRPMPLRFSIDRDRQDSKGSQKPRPTATPWSSRLVAKDPRMYINPEKTVPLTGPTSGTVTGSAVNRGDYETPLNVMLVTGATAPAAGTMHITGFNDTDMTIKIEAKANVAYRWYGDERVLMTSDISNPDAPTPPVLRMDLVTFATKNRKPMVPASISLINATPFATEYHYACTTTLDPRSRMFWNEAFA